MQARTVSTSVLDKMPASFYTSEVSMDIKRDAL